MRNYWNMRKFLIILTLCISGCKQETLSDIEIIKIDSNIINKLIEESDSVYYDTIRHFEGAKATLYFQKNKNELTKVFHDTLGNIVAILNYRNDSIINGTEYYANGQIMGKLPERKNGRLDGQARYYYDNGRVRSEGFFKNGLWFGEWKNYTKEGKIISIEYYVEGNINPIKTTKVK